MAPTTRQSLRKRGNEIEINNNRQLLKSKKQKSPSLRVQLRAKTVPELKNILRLNHQNPFGNKSDLISRILYMVKHGAYPNCPKCHQGRLKARLHRRKNQSKYYCPGFPISFRSPASYHQCDYVTDECQKETFHFPSGFFIKILKII